MTRRELLDRFNQLRVAIVGDMMVDEYVFGHVDRISPEAPVMVVLQESTTRLPGGAANVAVNVVAYGAKADVVGVVGFDGELLAESLARQGMSQHHLIVDSSRFTTRKTRVIADHRQQVLRIDHEDQSPLSPEIETRLREAAISALDQADVVIFSDYRKGCLSEETVRTIAQTARDKGVIAVANPKPQSVGWYSGINLVSLNRLEASASLGYKVTRANAQEASKALQELVGSPVLITLGGDGMVAMGSQYIEVEAHDVEVADPAGAGDTVIATVALGLAATGFTPFVFELAAHAAACVVRHVGVAAPDARDLEQLASG